VPDAQPGETLVTEPVGLFLTEGPVGFCAINLPRMQSKSLALMTAYPLPLRGIERSMIVVGVKQDCFGLEGWIDVETESGVPVSFFAVDYFVHPQRYFQDAEIQVCLSGLAYSVDVTTPQDVVITDLAKIQSYRAAGMDVPTGQPVRISMDKAAILFPIKGWDPFDYSFQGVVKSIERGPSGFHQLAVTVLRDGDDEIDVLLLARGRRTDFKPAVGAVVAGRMCIMGWLADHHWPAAK